MAHDLAELTTHCIRCGFCLEDCPTFQITGSEADSPRGRIYLVRSALEGKLEWQRDVAHHLDRCLGCLACETACPSGVEYGAILELARDRISVEKGNLIRKGLLTSTTRPRLLAAQLALAKTLGIKRLPDWLVALIGLPRQEANLPATAEWATEPPPLDDSTLPSLKGEVALLEGCAMRLLYPHVHVATRRLLRRVGFTVAPVDLGCCGALHAHNGELDAARSRGRALAGSVPGGVPLVVNSAGCGSTIKRYADLFAGGSELAKRTFDLSEFLLEHGLAEVLKRGSQLSGDRVTYHDACHLSHGQKITQAPRVLLAAIPGIDFAELPDGLTCCGSAGIYNVFQPDLARELLDQKLKSILSTGAEWVVLGNPGCHAWIAQGCAEIGGPRVVHLAEILERALSHPFAHA